MGLSDLLSLFTFMHWRRKWQPTPVFLAGESQGRGSLVAAVSGVAQSRTRLKWLSSSSMSLFGTFWKHRPKTEVKFYSVAFQNCISYLFFFLLIDICVMIRGLQMWVLLLWWKSLDNMQKHWCPTQVALCEWTHCVPHCLFWRVGVWKSD